jgi:hypothetical protein
VQYKVVPFQASISTIGRVEDVAEQLHSLISTETAGGWEYVRLETVETYVSGSSGCFGFGAEPPRMTSYTMAVFSRR